MSQFLLILKVLAAFPTIWVALKDLLGWLEAQFGPDWPTRIEDLRAAAEKWNTAQTTMERNDAAKRLASAFNSSK